MFSDIRKLLSARFNMISLAEEKCELSYFTIDILVLRKYTNLCHAFSKDSNRGSYFCEWRKLSGDFEYGLT